MMRWIRPSDRLAAAVAVGMFLASFSLKALTVDSSYLWLSIPAILIVMLISAIGRRFSINTALIHLWQVLAVLAAGVALAVSLQPDGGSVFTQIQELATNGLLHIQTQHTPMEPNPGATWMMVLLVALVSIVADLLVLTLATPAWVIAPMLTLYLIPTLAVPERLAPWWFLMLVPGYLVVLAADTANLFASWSRGIERDSAGRDGRTGGVWALAAVVTIPAMATALVLGLVAPTMGSLDLRGQRPRGTGPIQMQDPTIDLTRNLAQQSQDVMLTYQTSREQGAYLRLASLNTMDADSWKLEPVSLQTGELPKAPGLTAASTTFTTSVQMRSFSSQYLPAPYAPQSFQADGQWGYDPETLMVLSTSSNDTDATRNLSYQVTSETTDPDPASFNSAKAGNPGNASLTTVPDGVPSEIVQLANQITRNEPTPVLKAAALQAYLRDPQKFTYSVEAPSGDGFEVLKNFLFVNHKGYCIHFASAFALMARIVGIPSRVSVGFLPGTKNQNGWQVQGKDMHAWPELYFEGYGWVRFEPTAGVADAPPWTVVTAPLPSTSSTPTPSASTSSSQDPSQSASESASASQEHTTIAVEPDQGQDNGFAQALARLVPLLVLVLALLVIGAIPWAVRSSLRRRRLAPGRDARTTIEDGWAELRDTFVDVGTTWPSGSARERARTLAPSLRTEAAEALERVAVEVERVRYSRGVEQVPEGFGQDVETVRSDLTHHDSALRRFLVAAFPRSLVRNLFGRR